MPWRGPSYPGEFPTLGYQVLEFIESVAVQPDREGLGEPWRFTERQALDILHLYRLDPKTCRRVYRRGAILDPKGTGKGPFLAAEGVGELLGPVVPVGWDAYGEPVGAPWPTPWLQFAASAEDQTDNVWPLFYTMLDEGASKHFPELDAGLTRAYTPWNRGKAEPVTNAFGTREGQRITWAGLDETQLLRLANGGQKLARTIRRNLAKTNGLSVETGNAFVIGEGSVAETTAKEASKGQRGLYFRHNLPGEHHNLKTKRGLLAALRELYDGCDWIVIERLAEEFGDLSVPKGEAHRTFLNIPDKGEERLVDPTVWARRHDKDREPPAEGEPVLLCFDGSKNRDCTALLGWHLPPAGKAHLFVIRIWKRPEGVKPENWRVPRDEVDAEMKLAEEKWTVPVLVADPAGWYSECKAWEAEVFGEDRVLLFDFQQTKTLAKATSSFVAALNEGDFSHDGNADLADHVTNMGKGKRGGYEVPVKVATVAVTVTATEEDKIDAGVAAIIGWYGVENFEPPVPAMPGYYGST